MSESNRPSRFPFSFLQPYYNNLCMRAQCPLLRKSCLILLLLFLLNLPQYFTANLRNFSANSAYKNRRPGEWATARERVKKMVFAWFRVRRAPRAP